VQSNYLPTTKLYRYWEENSPRIGVKHAEAFRHLDLNWRTGALAGRQHLDGEFRQHRLTHEEEFLVAHPNEDLIRAGLDAFGKGDLDAVRGFFADDIAWHSPGRNPLAGDYKGIDQVMGLFARLFELTGGTFRLEVHDVLANDEHGVVLATAKAEKGGKTLSDNGVQVFHLRDGKVTESWLHPSDQYEADEFFS